MMFCQGLLWFLVGGCLLSVSDSFEIFLDSSQFDLFLMFRGSLDVSAYRFSGLSYFSTESLILAQDERWRRA